MGASVRLRSERIVCPGGTMAGELVVADGRIAAVEPADLVGGGRQGMETGSTSEVLELGDSWLVPGFIDCHVHGGGGAQCNTTDPDEVAAVARFHAQHGTTGLVATTVSASIDELCTSIKAIARCVGDEARGAGAVLGAHLEGPFLSPDRPGAMDPDTFLTPDPALLSRLLAAGDGSVRVMTLAPELPGALELGKSLVRAGVVASLGHTDASYAEAEAAIRAGARAATHTFNAMRPFDHRDPGVVGAVLDLPDVSCELICDGVHVEGPALRLVHRAKGNAGIRLVTDAMEAAGMSDGEYRLGGRKVAVVDGRATIAGGGSIAGSTLTMDAAVRNAARFLGVGVEEAVVMASTNPARLLGVADRKGAISAGMDADLVVLDGELSVAGTMLGGSWARFPGA